MNISIDTFPAGRGRKVVNKSIIFLRRSILSYLLIIRHIAVSHLDEEKTRKDLIHYTSRLFPLFNTKK